MASFFAAVGFPTTKGTLKLDELEKGIAKTMPEAEQFAKAEGSTALSGLATALDPGLRKLVSFWGMEQPARRCFVLAVLITAGHISWQESSQPKAKAKALITDGGKALSMLWEEAKEATRRAQELDPDAAGSLSAPSSAPHPRAVQGQETPREVQVVLRNGGQVNWATVQPSSANDASGYACPYRDRMACRLTGGSKEGAEDPSDKEESSKSAKHAAISASQCRHVSNMLPHSGAGAGKLKFDRLARDGSAAADQ